MKKHLVTAALFTVFSVIALGIVYPLVMTGISMLVFPAQANGSLVTANGKVVGSRIIGQQ